jgi:hypothetical protein
MEALGGERNIAPTHSQSRHKMEWVVSITPRPRFTPEERTPGTHCIGGWVGPRAGPDTEARGKILCPCRGSNPDRPVVLPVVRHYTAWANPAPLFVGKMVKVLKAPSKSRFLLLQCAELCRSTAQVRLTTFIATHVTAPDRDELVVSDIQCEELINVICGTVR